MHTSSMKLKKITQKRKFNSYKARYECTVD